MLLVLKSKPAMIAVIKMEELVHRDPCNACEDRPSKSQDDCWDQYHFRTDLWVLNMICEDQELYHSLVTISIIYNRKYLRADHR